MRRNFGAIVLMLLGLVLMTSGLTTDGGAAGAVVPCGTPLPAGFSPLCPIGTITIKKVVSGTGTEPAGGWSVTLTSSNCAIYGQKTFTVPSNGSVQTDPLLSTTDTAKSTKCRYTLTETAYRGYTTTYSPAQTVTLGISTTNPSSNNRTVTITNAGATPTSSAPTSSSASSSTSAAPPTTAHSSTPLATTSANGAGEPLANTGTNGVRPSVLIGALSVLAGLALAFAGRRPRGQHR